MTTKSNLRKIYVLHNKIIRLIYNLPHRHNTQHFFTEHSIINAFNLYDYGLLRYYKIEQKRRLSTLSGLAGMQTNKSHYQHRDQPRWVLPHTRKNYGLQRVSYQLPSQLNILHFAGIEITDITLAQLREFLVKSSNS